MVNVQIRYDQIEFRSDNDSYWKAQLAEKGTIDVLSKLDMPPNLCIRGQRYFLTATTTIDWTNQYKSFINGNMNHSGFVAPTLPHQN